LFYFSGSAIEPKWFTLDESRGHESPDNKVFMRMTVLVSEYFIYVPAVYVFVKWYYKKSTQKEQVRMLVCWFSIFYAWT